MVSTMLGAASPTAPAVLTAPSVWVVVWSGDKIALPPCSGWYCPMAEVVDATEAPEPSAAAAGGRRRVRLWDAPPRPVELKGFQPTDFGRGFNRACRAALLSARLARRNQALDP